MGKTRRAAVGYLRVSGLSQADKGGFERQRGTVEDFARREGYEIQRLYEETHSGADEDRPLFGEMVAHLANNCCRVVIVESMDRFARDMAVQCALLAKLEENGIVLLNATTGENVADAMASDPMRRALIQIQGVLAELDKNNAVARMRKGKAAKRARDRRAKVDGDYLYGAHPEKPGEAQVLAFIRRHRKSGRLCQRVTPFATIAEALNEQGTRNRRGREWNAESVRATYRRSSRR